MSAAPFSLGAGPDVCLLLHGLTGGPSEVRPVGEALAKAGFRAVAPLLPGHGTKPEDLVTVTREDLREAALRALAALHGARRVFVCGLSAGALLALELAAHSRLREGVPEVRRLALLAPAVELRGLSWVFTSVLGRMALPPLLAGKRRELPRASAEAGPLTDDGYAQVPLTWGRELRLLAREALQVARRVHAPTLILQGALDQTAAASGARRLARELGSQRVELRIFPRTGHLMPLDVESREVCSAVVSFFQES